MEPHRPDDGEADEVFDHELTHVLQTAGRNRASLIEEITICLANELAHGN
jgi:hypothetical protein